MLGEKHIQLPSLNRQKKITRAFTRKTTAADVAIVTVKGRLEKDIVR